MNRESRMSLMPSEHRWLSTQVEPRTFAQGARRWSTVRIGVAVVATLAALAGIAIIGIPILVRIGNNGEGPTVVPTSTPSSTVDCTSVSGCADGQIFVPSVFVHAQAYLVANQHDTVRVCATVRCVTLKYGGDGSENAQLVVGSGHGEVVRMTVEVDGSVRGKSSIFDTRLEETPMGYVSSVVVTSNGQLEVGGKLGQ